MITHPQTRILTALVESRSSSEALKSVFDAVKASNPKFSLEMLCKRAGISSRGYLSDVMRGRRTLNEKYVEPVLKVFQFSGADARFFKLLLERDQEKCEKKKQAIELKIDRMRKFLAVKSSVALSGLKEKFFALEVFVSFGLFGHQPTYEDIVGVFGKAREKKVRDALANLLDLGMIEVEGERYRALDSAALFNGQQDQSLQIAFLKDSLRQAEENMESHFYTRDQAYFCATLLSVKLSDYEKFLNQFREQVFQIRSEWESDHGDAVVRLNIQIYPSVRKGGPT